jgi:hypothetical protein
MRAIAALLLASIAQMCSAQSSDEKDVVAAVQKLFDAMAAHDSDAARTVIVPEGRLFSANDEGKVSSLTLEEFAGRLSAAKAQMLERIWNPKVFVRGRIAHLWAEYDFQLNGKFHHCGVDSIALVKSADGWKITGIEDTRETSGCSPSPLGPPRN